MIKKTLLVASLLFFSYSVFVIWFAPKQWSASQHQWQDNVIKAQQYLFTKDTFTNVIVGSSLSSRLITDSLPQTYILAFSGQSIFDGLNILNNSDKLPRNVFVEMNTVLRPENKDFTAGLHSLLYYPKKVLPSLRDDKQPIAVIGKALVYKVGLKVVDFVKAHSHKTQTSAGEDLFPKLLQLQLDDYSKLPEDKTLNEAFENLQGLVTSMEKKHVRVIFFEMPVNGALENLPKANMIRQTFYKNFPKSAFSYIPMPDSLKLKTTDGLHLNEEEAKIYSSYLNKEMKACLR